MQCVCIENARGAGGYQKLHFVHFQWKNDYLEKDVKMSCKSFFVVWLMLQQ